MGGCKRENGLYVVSFKAFGWLPLRSSAAQFAHWTSEPVELAAAPRRSSDCAGRAAARENSPTRSPCLDGQSHGVPSDRSSSLGCRLVFAAAGAEHQLLDRLAGVFPLFENQFHLLGNWHLDAVPARESKRSTRRQYTFSDFATKTFQNLG